MGGILAAMEPVQTVSILVKAAMYVGALLAAGSIINLWLLTELDAVARRRLRRVAAVSAVAGVVFGGLGIPLRAAFLYGGFEGAVDPVMLQVVLFSPLGYSVGVMALGLAAVFVVVLDHRRTGLIALLGALLVAGSFALRGHAVSQPRAILSALFAIHIVAASFWIGGFYPLHDMAGRGAAAAARTADRFGRAALVMVGLLILAGTSLLWLLAGNPIAALAQPWGQFIALKLMIVAGLLGLAGLNKLRLTPALAATGDGGPLCRSIRWEAAAFLAILLITAAITSLVAPEHAG